MYYVFINQILKATLASGIDVCPTLIHFGFFSRPYGLIREYIKVIQMVIQYIGHVYLRPYVYYFCQTFQALRLFPTLRLFRRLEQPLKIGRIKKIMHYVYSRPYVYYFCQIFQDLRLFPASQTKLLTARDQQKDVWIGFFIKRK